MQMLVVGSRTGPIASAKTQVNGSVDLGGHNTNRSLVATGGVIDLVSPSRIGLA
jgi:hypothetical protein